MKKSISKFSGFTLIELLVVIGIIALLTAIILPSLSGSKGKARDAQRVSDLAQLQLSLELYYDRCGQYPSVLSTGTATNCTTPNGTVNLGNYISQIPTPPAGVTGVASYDYATYSMPSGPLVNYVLHAQLESSNAAVAKGLNAMPSLPNPNPNNYSWSASYTCSNASNSVNYCVTSN